MAKYQQYKDSGFEWLGEVPSHWKVCRLKHVKANKPNAFVDGPFGSNLKSIHFVDDGDVYVIESNFATTGIINEDNLKTITSIHFQTISRSEAEVGDIIIAKIGARFGMSSILPKLTKKSVVSGNSLKLTINSKVCNTEYVHYLLQHSKSESAMDDGVNVTAQPALSLGGLNNLPFLLPSSEEQENITKFLSYETAQIDTLIDKQQTLIQLLKEKRQAVISHAVTKGLNPDAPMKDSGVEWLGEVPEHWTVSFVKYIVLGEKDSMVDGPFGSSVNTSEDYVDDGIPVIRTVNITNNGFSSDNLKFMRQQKFDQLKRHSVKPGDVLFSKVGTIGNACLLPSDIPEAILSTTGSCKISVDQNKIEGEYLVLMFHLMNQTLMEMANSNVQPFLNMSNIKNLKISLPSIEEQKNILTYLEEKLEGIDDLIAKSLSFDKLIRERRTALISAAVTGKIDVRGWQAPE